MASASLEKPSLSIRLRYGVTLQVPTSLQVTTTYVLLEQEAWFEDEVDFLRLLLRPGDCVIDIGANFGVYTTTMAEAVGPKGKIFAFEPAAETAAHLRATIQPKHGTQVEVIQAAVSDRAGRQRLKLGATPELNALSEDAGTSEGTEIVELLSLDDFLGRHGNIRIALIKIDAEGHEPQVGLGARHAIVRDEPVLLFEIRHGHDMQLGFLEFVESLGFSAYRLAPGMNALLPYNKKDALDPYQLNLFACSKDRAAELHARGLLILPSTIDTPLAPARYAFQPPLFAFGNFPAPETAYGLAIAHYASAKMHSTELSMRMLHMWHAFHFAKIACNEKNSVTRRVTLARIAADLGFRAAATDVMHGMIGALTQDAMAKPDEPCLPPAAGFASVDPDPAPESLRIATLEAYERLRAYSSRFANVKSLPFLEYICRHPLSSAEMHRRRQLTKLLYGLQARPEPHPKLLRERPDNLNTWFWRG